MHVAYRAIRHVPSITALQRSLTVPSGPACLPYYLSGTRFASQSPKNQDRAVMKRKEAPSKASKPAKKARAEVPEYHLSETVKDEHGDPIWPAPPDQIRRAREIITECAQANKKTIIVPDKDADGLTSGVILHRTLQILGLSPDLISFHLPEKGTTVHADTERERMSALSPSYIFVLDQGSRHSPPLIDQPHTALVVDHHFATAEDFPEKSEHVSACHSPPVATSSLLTYLLCEPLHPHVAEQTDWLCVVGTHGDLGNTIKWEAPFPDMAATLKQYSKKTLNEVVSAVNAPRRTATYDVQSALTALVTAKHPKDVMKFPRLAAARAEVSEEVERCTHTAPKFSPDGKIAVFRISSQCQVHPIIATRWAGHLNSKALEIVMVANEGYLDGKVNFSCRIARCARARGDDVDIIRSLRAYASLEPETTGELKVDPEDDAQSKGNTYAAEDKRPLLERLGNDFARGHVQASGGIVNRDEFEELLRLMRIGEKSDAQKRREEEKQKGGTGTKKVGDKGQKNTLMSYFGSGKKPESQSKGEAIA